MAERKRDCYIQEGCQTWSQQLQTSFAHIGDVQNIRARSVLTDYATLHKTQVHKPFTTWVPKGIKLRNPVGNNCGPATEAPWWQTTNRPNHPWLSEGVRQSAPPTPFTQTTWERHSRTAARMADVLSHWANTASHRGWLRVHGGSGHVRSATRNGIRSADVPHLHQWHHERD